MFLVFNLFLYENKRIITHKYLIKHKENKLIITFNKVLIICFLYTLLGIF